MPPGSRCPSCGTGRSRQEASAKKAPKKRRQLSPAARAKLAKNLERARAARARNLRAATKSARNKATRKS